MYPTFLLPFHGVMALMQINNHASGFIRHQGTGRYFAGRGRWVETRACATKYYSLSEMTDVCLAFGLKDVELILEREYANSLLASMAA